MISAASPPSSDTFVTSEAGIDYFASETHYLSLAGRIIAALHGGGSLVLVIGEPPASPHLLARALGKLVASPRAVIKIRCGSELTRDEVLRAASAVTRLPANSGGTLAPQPSERAPLLFVFDDTDQLSDSQIKDIYEAAQHGDWVGAAGVLLARPGFLTRLEEPTLQFLKEALTGTFSIQDVGREEGIDFLRHQLANRHRSTETHRAPRGVLRTFVLLAVLATAGIAAFLMLRPVEQGGEPSATGISSTGEYSVPGPTPNVLTSVVPPKTAPAAEPPATYPSAPPPAATAQPVQAPQAAIPPGATPAPAQPLATPRATPPLASPSAAQPPAGQDLSPAEIAALVARGNGFLSTGDIASARLFYERAADAGSGPAALRLGATFDPGFLDRAGIRGIPGDPDQAASWYRRGRELGNAAADDRRQALEPRGPAELGVPAR